ncbi:amidase [Natrarchaeobius oligotrophus]|uniref:Amidase n=1 Tax=Natrarchaeobius chitinivorans TaxID=1679083 RepID=A0A3N6N170_NATCH|nr:amidase [Natrarchaeobius chitinivorans]RQH02602.1 amidase [Natrarchaeobius chitinivorans]
MGDELALTSAAALAREIRAGERSPVDVVDYFLERIERHDDVNAFTATRANEARAEARRAEKAVEAGENLGPLHGVPVALKDLFVWKDGLGNTFGSTPFTDFVPDESAIVTERLERAGAIVIGTTNTCEFGHKGLTDNRVFGPTSTPFDLDRNAGGSTGGSTAAVGAGLVPLAVGEDGGGSIRIPAAWSGVYGLKPTFGRVPIRARPNGFQLHTPFVHHGPQTRTVEDAALMLDVVAGPHPDDPFSLPAEADDSYLAAMRRSIADFDVAYSPHFGDFPVDQRVLDVVGNAVRAFETAGATVDRLDFEFPYSHETITELWVDSFAVFYRELAHHLGEEGLPNLLERTNELCPQFAAKLERGRGVDAVDYKRNDVVRTGIFDAIQEVLTEYDLLVTPTVAVPPVENAANGQTLGPSEIDGEAVERTIGFCLTHPLNFTGHPAASVPAGVTDDGLPIGMQLIGSRFDEASILAASGAVERVRPWDHHYEEILPN